VLNVAFFKAGLPHMPFLVRQPKVHQLHLHRPVPSSTFRSGVRPSLLSFGYTPGSLSTSVGEAVGVEDLLVGVLMSSAEAVETGLTAAEAATYSAPTCFSLCASSFSSLESLRMMTLPSLSGPRRSRLS
jgi:hypothetical protein